MDKHNSGTAANRDGKGSTYGGTQSPDPNAPDGYQKPQPGKHAGNTDPKKDTGLGDEYAEGSSFGKEEESPATAAGDKGGDAGTGAGGSGVR